MDDYFFFIQGEKHRDSPAITRLFNDVERKKNMQKNVNLLLNYSLDLQK